MSTPNNLTALDFNDIKASIKSYLRTRKEFSDYDFDGSALSYLIDMLAYNTYYTSFNANMALNEAFFLMDLPHQVKYQLNHSLLVLQEIPYQ